MNIHRLFVDPQTSSDLPLGRSLLLVYAVTNESPEAREERAVERVARERPEVRTGEEDESEGAAGVAVGK